MDLLAAWRLVGLGAFPYGMLLSFLLPACATPIRPEAQRPSQMGTASTNTDIIDSETEQGGRLGYFVADAEDGHGSVEGAV